MNILKFSLPAALMLCCYSPNAFSISLSLVKSVEIRESMEKNQNNNHIFTVSRAPRRNREIFRKPPGSNSYGPKWTNYPLIYVKPGGLEPASGGFLFPLDRELGGTYASGSFSFSGPAASLIYINGMGWGTENTNGDFMPYLVQSDYQDIREPSYEFFWSPKEKFETTKTGPNTEETKQKRGNITLNYLFRVPKQSKIKWGTENSFTRFSFSGGARVNVPDVARGGVFKWNNMGFEEISNALSSSLLRWNIPQNIAITGFTLSEQENIVYIASQDGKITAYRTSDGKKLWETLGNAPLILYKSGIFTIDSSYQNIQYVTASNGLVLKSFPLPRFLPRVNNTIATASFGRDDFLFLQVPEQTRILCYKIEN